MVFRKISAALWMLILSSLDVVASNKPNIILNLVDDLGYSDLSFLPQTPADVKKAGAPAIDKLAETGVCFDNAYATAPICSPSRTGSDCQKN